MNQGESEGTNILPVEPEAVTADEWVFSPGASLCTVLVQHGIRTQYGCQRILRFVQGNAYITAAKYQTKGQIAVDEP